MAEPGAPQVAGVAAEPGARQAAVEVAAPDGQREAAASDAAVAAVPDAQQAAAVEPDAQQAVAVEPDAQQAVAVALDAAQGAAVAAVSDAQPVAAASDVQQAAVLAPMVGAVKLRVRPLVASAEPAEMAAVRLWSRPVLFSTPVPERGVVSAARVQAAADR